MLSHIYVCTYVRVYIQPLLYVYIHIHERMFGQISICVYSWTLYMPTWACVDLLTCLCGCVYIYMYYFVFLYTCVHICMPVNVRVLLPSTKRFHFHNFVQQQSTKKRLSFLEISFFFLLLYHLCF